MEAVLAFSGGAHPQSVMFSRRLIGKGDHQREVTVWLVSGKVVKVAEKTLSGADAG